MKLFAAQPLPARAKVAVIANDALGNFVVSTPLLQMIRQQLAPGELHYFGGIRTRELEIESDLIDVSHPLHGTPVRESAHDLAELAGTFDLVINLENSELAKTTVPLLTKKEGYFVGPSLGDEGRHIGEDENFNLRQDLQSDPNWMSEDLTSRYPFLESGFIGEIFCRLAYLSGPIPRYKVPCKKPPTAIPDVLISTAATSADKLWPKDYWIEVLTWLAETGLTAGVLGASPNLQRAYWKGDNVEDELVRQGLVQDLRGQFTLPEVVGALKEARAVFTLDNGIGHLAASTDTPTIALFRHGIHRLWAPPVATLDVLEAGPGSLVSDLSPDRAIAALGHRLFGLPEALATTSQSRGHLH